MRNPRSADRERLSFTVSTARTLRLSKSPEGPPLLPWPVAALGGGATAALAGTVLVCGVVMIAWFSAIAIPLPEVLEFGSRAWLLAHGGTLPIGTDAVTLVPLGLTAGLAALCASVGRFAARQGRLALTAEPDARQRRRLLWGTAGQVAAGYTTVAAVLGLAVVGEGWWRPASGALLLSAFAGAVGAALAEQGRPWAGAPAWVLQGVRGAAAGALGLLALGSVLLATALVLAEHRVADLEASLGIDAGGVVVWTLVVLAFLPNLLAWVLAWALGAGFTVGAGSVVSLSGTQLGMLPAIPVLAALPPTGVGSPWLLAWLAGGVVVGALAGVVAVRRQRTGPLGALAAGALAGGLLAAGFLGWAAASRGGLGSLRLVALGPRLLEVVAVAVPLLALSSVLAAVVGWAVRRRRPAA